MKKTGKKLTKKTGDEVSFATKDIEPSSVSPVLLGDLQSLIESTRVRVAVGINTEIVLLYWDIGDRIRKEILGNERAVYGKQVVNGLSDQLTLQYGRGFTRANLFHMIHFVEAFPDRKKVYTLCRQLSWSHFRSLLSIEDSLAREFYTEMCRRTMECPDPAGKDPGDVVRTYCPLEETGRACTKGTCSAP